MLLPIQDFEPAPSDDFICYPGRLPEYSYVYSEQGLTPLSSKSPLQDAAAVLREFDSTPLSERIAVLAYGSNANPVQIAKKMSIFNQDRTVPLLLGEVAGLTPVYAGHISTYGAIPATLDFIPGKQNHIFLALFTCQQLKATIQSEHGNYALCHAINAVIHLPGTDKPLPFYTFVSHKGVLILDGKPVPISSRNEEEILNILLQNITGENGIPDFEIYRKDPLPYRTAIEKAITTLGLRRPHQNEWMKVQLADLRHVFEE